MGALESQQKWTGCPWTEPCPVASKAPRGHPARRSAEFAFNFLAGVFRASTLHKALGQALGRVEGCSSAHSVMASLVLSPRIYGALIV